MSDSGVKQSLSLWETIYKVTEQSVKDENTAFCGLDSNSYIVVLPPHFGYSEDDLRQCAREIKNNLLETKHPERKFHIFPWQSLENQIPSLSSKPSIALPLLEYLERHLLDGLRICLLVDSDRIRVKTEKALENAGFGIQMALKPETCVCENGNFEHQVEIPQLLANAIVHEGSVEKAIESEIQKTHLSFKNYALIEAGLKKHFNDIEFERVQKQVYAKGGSRFGAIDYQNIHELMSFHSCYLEEIYQSLSLEDLYKRHAYPTLQLRSHEYAKAFPENLFIKKDGFGISYDWESENRLKGIQDASSGPSALTRSLFFEKETKRHAGKRYFAAKLVDLRENDFFAVALVGSKVSSIALNPGLLKGSLRELEDCPEKIQAIAHHEDALVLACKDAPSDVTEKLLKRCELLLKIRSHDGSDSLLFEEQIDLGVQAVGRFTISTIPEAFFDLLETAHDDTLTLPPGREAFLEGLAYEIIGDWAEALRHFKNSYQQAPSDGDFCHAFGRALMENGKYQSALEILERATRYLPNDAELFNTLGLTYKRCHNWVFAQGSLEKAVKLCPDDPRYLINLGQVYLKRGALKHASDKLEKAMEYVPENAELHALMASLNNKKGDGERARWHAKKAFSIDPKNRHLKSLFLALELRMDEDFLTR